MNPPGRVRSFVSSYPKRKAGFGIRTAVVVLLGTVTAGGCATLNQPAKDPLKGQIEYMRRAAQADPRTREQMKTEADRTARDAPLKSRLELGFLLTSPDENQTHTQAGEKILREILTGDPGLDPRLRDLIEIRLQDAESRRALQEELVNVKSKINQLLSIESSATSKSKPDPQAPK